MRQHVLLIAAVSFLGSSAMLEGQSRGVDLNAGRWFADSGGVIGTAAYYRHLFGPIDYGVGLTFLLSEGLQETLQQTGGELTVSIWRNGSGPYLAAAAGVGVWHHSGALDAQWSAGGGYAYQPLKWLSLGVEARYRVEDRDFQGFWRLSSDDRRGMLLMGRVSVNLATPRRIVYEDDDRGNQPTVPANRIIATEASTDAGSATTADLRMRVIRTALAAMGTPYKWGGTDSNGFDCSGLIQYSFGEHGIELPRISRDQARSGEHIQRRMDVLRPGDILGFAASGTRVTHVGLYVGEGKFIHSASDGVKLSSLRADDANSRWWAQRWVSARRVID